MRIVPDDTQKAVVADPIQSRVQLNVNATSEEIKREVSHNSGKEWRIQINGIQQEGVFFSISNCYRYVIANFAKWHRDTYPDSLGRNVLTVSFICTQTKKRVHFFLPAAENGLDCETRFKTFKMTDFNVEEWLDRETTIRVRLMNEQSAKRSENRRKFLERKEEVLTPPPSEEVQKVLDGILKDLDALGTEEEKEDPIVSLEVSNEGTWLFFCAGLLIVLFTIFGIVKWLF